MSTKPTVVCLCGSTRFKAEFEAAERAETLAGRVVLTVGFFEQHDGEELPAEVTARLSELHRAKIEMADEILVIDRDGYIGPATGDEVAYAQRLGKPIRRWSERPR